MKREKRVVRYMVAGIRPGTQVEVIQEVDPAHLLVEVKEGDQKRRVMVPKLALRKGGEDGPQEEA